MRAQRFSRTRRPSSRLAPAIPEPQHGGGQWYSCSCTGSQWYSCTGCHTMYTIPPCGSRVQPATQWASTLHAGLDLYTLPPSLKLPRAMDSSCILGLQPVVLGPHAVRLIHTRSHQVHTRSTAGGRFALHIALSASPPDPSHPPSYPPPPHHHPPPPPDPPSSSSPQRAQSLPLTPARLLLIPPL